MPRVAVFAALLLFTLPAALQAPFNYTTNNGTITITSYMGPGGAVTIPSAINGFPVSNIGSNAFYNSRSLTRITIPNSVTNIGQRAFYQCSSLTNVTIPNSVTIIGNSAFYRCTKLSSISIPSSVINIGDRTFSRCSSLSTITVDALNSSYSSVNGVLFDKNQTTLIQFPLSKAGNYSIPNSVTNIGNFAFDYCTSLTNVAIPNSDASFGVNAGGPIVSVQIAVGAAETIGNQLPA